jgi:pimeloyl-[acyl-carrier protein] synthase
MTSAPPLSRKEQAEFSLFQLYKPEVLANPYPLYRRIREFEPVHWDPFLHAWVVTTYAEVVTVLTRCKAARTPTPEHMDAMGLAVLGPYAEMMRRQILFMDAPAHTRIRSICAVAFTPRRVDLLRERLQQIADSLIDRVSPLGKMDVVADFAGHFPSLMLAALIGVPAEDHLQLRAWAASFGELVGNTEHDPDRIPALTAGLEALREYITAEVLSQQTNPREGLISTLLEAEIDGARLTRDEVVANTILMLGGGSDEMSNLIANGLFTLLSNPAEQARLTAHPEIIQTAVEELLRSESTTQYTGRIAPEDMTLSGKQIRKGEAITAVLAAANRDPQRFPNPDQLDLTRTDNRHVAFSWAAHYCLGAPLVRMAAAIAFSTLLRRLPGLTLVGNLPKWRAMAAMRALQSLPVTFQSAPGSACHQVI